MVQGVARHAACAEQVGKLAMRVSLTGRELQRTAVVRFRAWRIRSRCTRTNQKDRRGEALKNCVCMD
jgi:hypothetical protein